MYKLDCDASLQQSFVLSEHSALLSQDLWHRRMGHAGVNNMKKLKDVVSGVNFAVMNGKQTRGPFNSIGTRATEILELIHSDLCGPIQTVSNGGAKYLLTFIDDYTRKDFVYFLKNKSEVKDKFVEFKLLFENQSGKQI